MIPLHESRGRSSRTLLLAIAFIISSLSTAFALDALAVRADPSPVFWRPSRVEEHLESLVRLGEPSAPASGRRVVMLGDSTVAAYAEGFDLADLTQAALEAAHPRNEPVRVVHQAFPARGIATSLLLGDLVADAQPDLVVWQVNLAHFAKRWRRQFSIPEASGWVSLRRLPELVTYPIHEIGLTTSDILLYQALVRMDAYDLWRATRTAQLRVGRLTGVAAAWLNPNVGIHPEARIAGQRLFTSRRRALHADKRRRFTADGERQHYDEALAGLNPDHVMVRLLAFGVRSYTEQGLPVLVFLNPINVEHLADEGVLDPPRLEQSIATIESAVRSAGGHVLDLHDLFPDSDFADEAGHYRINANHSIPRALASRLALVIREILDDDPRTELN